MSNVGQVSPDGLWWWDGTAWQPTEKQAAPAQASQPSQMVSETDASAHPFGSHRLDRKAAKAAEREAARQSAGREREARGFAASPVGRARAAFARGDQVFQYSIDVMNQQAVIVAMVGSGTTKKDSDPSDVLNAVCREGWELVR